MPHTNREQHHWDVAYTRDRTRTRTRGWAGSHLLLLQLHLPSRTFDPLSFCPRLSLYKSLFKRGLLAGKIPHVCTGTVP